MIVTNGLIVYAWVQAYILENDNFVLMGLLWAIYIATVCSPIGAKGALTIVKSNLESKSSNRPKTH
jgi:hypothetical protein